LIVDYALGTNLFGMTDTFSAWLQQLVNPLASTPAATQQSTTDSPFVCTNDDDVVSAVQSNKRFVLAKNLTELYLGACFTKPEHIKFLLDSLKESSTEVRLLDLSHNNLTLSETQTICEFLQRKNSLTKLDISNNTIGSNGATLISDSLKHNTTLKALWLVDNKIGDEGAKGISELLKINIRINKISLEQNEIGPVGAKAISEGLKKNNSITFFSLIGNNIGKEGYSYLAEALNVNCSLNQRFDKFCDLVQCDPSTAATMQQNLKANQEISKMIGWPTSHFKLTPNLNSVILEICFCSKSLPIEILASIVDKVVVISAKSQTPTKT